MCASVHKMPVNLTGPGTSKGRFVEAIIQWYQSHGRKLPWRHKIPNAYHTLVSEFMLQQTTVPTVIPYFLSFIQRWPTLKALAEAPVESVLHAWQGLGYYTRARSLHQTAQIVTTKKDGMLPDDRYSLLQLPGIGPYTASAIRCIAFNQPDLAVDGNLERIFSRIEKLKGSKKSLNAQVTELRSQYMPRSNYGDYAQALMDLGATICKSRTPLCVKCPVSAHCQSFRSQETHLFPEKGGIKKSPLRYGHFFWIYNQARQELLMEIEKDKLLSGLWRPKRSPFSAHPAEPIFPVNSPFKALGEIRHTFTHFKLQIILWLSTPSSVSMLSAAETWVKISDLKELALSTLTKKALKVLLSHIPCKREKKTNDIRH